MAEFALIELIRERTAVARDDVRLGIGDDAAILVPPVGKELVVSTDMLVSGVHFPEATNPFDIGWKSLAVNLSDLAAMGAVPAWATLGLAMPAADPAWVAVFADGFGTLARQHNLALVGGDTTRGPLTISVTVHGFVDAGRALRRDGARIGDIVFVTGTLGDAAAGLRIALGCDEERPGHAYLVERLSRPDPRVAAGLALSGIVNSCIDISDGLFADLGHVCRRSGVGAEIDSATLPRSAGFAGHADSSALLALQLYGGDDYELCFSASAGSCERAIAAVRLTGVAVTPIGRIVSGSGVCVFDALGLPVDVENAGWEHFVS